MMPDFLTIGDCGCPCQLPCVIGRTVEVYSAGACGAVDFLSQQQLPGGVEGRFKTTTTTTTNETGSVVNTRTYFRGADNIECRQSVTETPTPETAVVLGQSFGGTVEEISRTATKVITHFKDQSGQVFQTVVTEHSDYDDAFTGQNEFNSLKAFAEGFILASLPWGGFLRIYLDANFAESSRTEVQISDFEAAQAHYEGRFPGVQFNSTSFRRAEALIQPIGVNGTCCFCIWDSAVDLFGSPVQPAALIETNQYRNANGFGACTQIPSERIVQLEPIYIAGALYVKIANGSADIGEPEFCYGPPP